MTAMQLLAEPTDLHHAVNEIQSEWSPRERARRHRLAELRQQRLARLLSPLPRGEAYARVEAYDCRCDLGGGFADANDTSGEVRSHRYVLIEG